jgi:hypothetical protein
MTLMTLHRAHFEPSKRRHGFSESLYRGLASLLGTIKHWNLKRTDDEIGCSIQRSGGRMTDALEREIAERGITRGFGT